LSLKTLPSHAIGGHHKDIKNIKILTIKRPYIIKKHYQNKLSLREQLCVIFCVRFCTDNTTH